MTTYAVTGHLDLTDQSVGLVRGALGELLAGGGPGLVGVSCLARGADTVFAEAVLGAGGSLVAVLPSRDYRRAEVKGDDLPVFDRLVRAAAEVVVMPHETAGGAAYEAANGELLRRADVLVAVWDGRPAAARGGTAHAVAQAREAGVRVVRVWPDGAARS